MNIYADNFNSSEVIDKFFESHRLPKRAQAELKNVNSSIPTKKVELLFLLLFLEPPCK